MQILLGLMVIFMGLTYLWSQFSAKQVKAGYKNVVSKIKKLKK